MATAAALVAQYVGYTPSPSPSGPSATLQARDGSVLSGLATVARYLAAQSESKSLGGATPEAQAQVGGEVIRAAACVALASMHACMLPTSVMHRMWGHGHLRTVVWALTHAVGDLPAPPSSALVPARPRTRSTNGSHGRPRS